MSSLHTAGKCWRQDLNILFHYFILKVETNNWISIKRTNIYIFNGYLLNELMAYSQNLFKHVRHER